MNVLLVYHHGGWRNMGFPHEKYYKAAGHEVVTIPLESTPHWTNWRDRLPFYLPKGLPTSLSSVSKKYPRPFDAVIEYEGDWLYHLSGMKKSSALKAVWACDIYRKDKQSFYRWMEKDFDVIFVAQKSFLPFFKERPAYWMPYACDPAVHKKFDLPKIYEISFIGNMSPAVYPERVKLLDALAKKFQVKIFNGVWGEEVSRIYSQSKIVFNKSHSDEVNMRVFDVLSCGTLLATDRAGNGLSEILKDKEHLVYYDQLEDLTETIKYYLSHDEEREAIALKGMKEVHEKHTFYNRTRDAMKILENFKK